MNKLKQIILGGRAFLRVVKDPHRTGDVFDVSAALSDPRVLEPMRQDLAAQSDAFSRQPLLGKVELDALQALPPGTLGRAFADHMRARGFEPEFYPRVDVKNDYDYMRRHLYETHDIWHVLTGFDTDVAGEVGLQAFYASQIPRAGLAPAIIAAVLLNSVVYDLDSVEPRMRAVATGYKLGKLARPLFGVDWAKLWTESLTSVRRQFNIDVA